MDNLTKIHSIRFSQTQAKSLQILKQHGVIVSKFIRQAVKEKIQRDWKEIQAEHNKQKQPKCPF